MNTHTLRPIGSTKKGIPGTVDTEYFMCRNEGIRLNPERWDVQRIKRAYPNGDAQNQLELRV